MLSVYILFAQKVQANVDYIYKYYKEAIAQQKKYQIPASITLAQGILESGSGKGRLAVKANNHFGIKCAGWKGGKIYHDDDRKGECFRKYNSPLESYEDHSLFLVNRDHYSFLFDLRVTDYKGWAKGLKKAGYATDPKYPTKLINIIETYELHKYDKMTVSSSNRPVKQENKKVSSDSNSFPSWFIPHQVYKDNELYYIIAREGDNYDLISKEFTISSRKLRSYNDVPKNYPIQKGEVIYLCRKNTKVSRKAERWHTVEDGESMHTISQKYGIRMKYLYSINKKQYSYIPKAGDSIKLR